MTEAISKVTPVRRRGGIFVDARHEPRVPISLSGRVVLADLTDSRDIMIRDISYGGAKLRVGEGAELPKQFYLLIKCTNDRDYVRRTCEKRWQVGDMVGVRFQAPLEKADLDAVLSAAKTW